MAVAMTNVLGTIFNTGNKVTQTGTNDTANGHGNDNTVMQDGTFFHASSAHIEGDRNGVVQGRGGDAVINGDDNGVTQRGGTNDSVTIGDNGVLGLFGHDGHRDHVDQNGSDNTARVNGDDDNVRQQGDGGTVHVDGDRNSVDTLGNNHEITISGHDVNLRVQGEGNNVNLSSDGSERVSVFGNNLTVRQANGQIVATDDQGNSVPVRRGADGTYVVGSSPEAESALNAGGQTQAGGYCAPRHGGYIPEQPDVAQSIDAYDCDRTSTSKSSTSQDLLKTLGYVVGMPMFGPFYPALFS